MRPLFLNQDIHTLLMPIRHCLNAHLSIQTLLRSIEKFHLDVVASESTILLCLCLKHSSIFSLKLSLMHHWITSQTLFILIMVQHLNSRWTETSMNSSPLSNDHWTLSLILSHQLHTFWIRSSYRDMLSWLIDCFIHLTPGHSIISRQLSPLSNSFVHCIITWNDLLILPYTADWDEICSFHIRWNLLTRVIL